MNPPHLPWFVRGDTGVFTRGSVLTNGHEGVRSRAVSHDRVKRACVSHQMHMVL